MSWGSQVRALLVIALSGALLGGAPELSAQATGRVSGRVVGAATQRPLAGAQVHVVGSGRGSLTDAAGEFVIPAVPAGPHTLRVQLLGYAAAEVAVVVPTGGSASVEVALAESPIALDEVVVTGQPGATRRRAIGASVAVLDAESQTRRMPTATLAQLLQGREPGVTALGASGTAGTTSTLVLRGMTSINQSNSPAVYVDGVRVDMSEKPLFFGSLGGQSTSRLNDLNPADIERVEVVRGAAASALYGSEASSGVIQVFTKRGRAGADEMTASVRVGGTRIPDVFPRMHPDAQYLSANDLLRTGAYQQYSVGLRGGSEATQHYVSGSYLSDEGSFPSNRFERANGLINLRLQPREQLDVRLSSNFAWSRAALPMNDNNALGVLFNVMSGNPALRGTPADPYGGRILPVPYALDVENTDETYRFAGGATVQHQPSAGLRHSLTVGVDVLGGEGISQWPFAPNPMYPRGSRQVARRTGLNSNAEYAASWTRDLSDRVESVLSVGGQVYSVRDHRVYSAGSTFPTPGLNLLGATTTAREVDEELLEYTTGGLFVQEQLGFSDRLYLTAGLRVDGSSAFGEDFGLQPYPKASVSYVVSEEEWFRLPGVSTLRLRGGFGMAGMQPGAFDAVRTYTPFSAVGGQPAIHVGEIGNPELAPEVSREWEGGLDASLLGDRVSLSLSAYHQTTRDAILRREIAPSSGFLSSQLVNLGEIRNVGVEISTQAALARTDRMAWSVSAGYAYNDNEVVDMGGATPFVLDRFGTQVTEGYPLGSKFQMVSTGTTGAGMPIPSAAPEYVGTGVPPHTGSLGSQLSWGALELFANAQWAAGHVVTNNTRAYMLQSRTGEEYFEAVIANDDSPTAPASPEVQALLARAALLGEFTEAGDWLKLREVGATYSLPAGWARRMGAGSAALSLSARNLLTLTGYSGADPEVSATVVPPPADGYVVGKAMGSSYSVGNDFFTVPQARQLVLGIDVRF